MAVCENPVRLNVLAPGTKIIVGDSIAAVVLRVSISAESRVTYECAWWNGNQLNREYLEEFQVTPSDTGQTTLAIGFAR